MGRMYWLLLILFITGCVDSALKEEIPQRLPSLTKLVESTRSLKNEAVQVPEKYMANIGIN